MIAGSSDPRLILWTCPKCGQGRYVLPGERKLVCPVCGYTGKVDGPKQGEKEQGR